MANHQNTDVATPLSRVSLLGMGKATGKDVNMSKKGLKAIGIAGASVQSSQR
jgi:hypothetical protein